MGSNTHVPLAFNEFTASTILLLSKLYTLSSLDCGIDLKNFLTGDLGELDLKFDSIFGGSRILGASVALALVPVFSTTRKK